MKRPRCGVRDRFVQPDGANVRRKRFVLTGQKWDKDKLTYRYISYFFTHHSYVACYNPMNVLFGQSVCRYYVF